MFIFSQREGIEIRSLKIVKKPKYSEKVGYCDYFYGIVIVDSKDKDYLLSPTYPFSSRKEDLVAFVAQYEEELLAFYKNGVRNYFTSYLFHFDTELKEKFSKRWFEKGVLID